MSAQPRRDDLEPISPELVLVSSPEDARRARERLPQTQPAVEPVPARPRPVAVQAAIRWPDVVEEPPAPARPRRRGAVLIGIAFVAAFVGGYLVETRLRAHHSQPGAELQTAPGTVAAAASTPATQGSSPPRTTAPRSSVTATGKAGGTATTPRATQPASASKSGPPPPPAAFVPARSWSWAPSLDARAYVVTFFLDGRVVFRARPTRPRLVLPSTFRFRPGSYRWTVRPVPATANGKPIIDGRFVLKPSAAAAANKGGG
jgi:hypothetical protein